MIRQYIVIFLLLMNFACLGKLFLIKTRNNELKEYKDWYKEIIESNINQLNKDENQEYDIQLMVPNRACGTCINDGVNLLIDVLGIERVRKSVSIIKSPTYIYNHNIIKIINKENLTTVDGNHPYLSIISSASGKVLINIPMNPDKRSFNKKILSSLK